MENLIDEKLDLLDRLMEVYSLDILGQPIGLLAHSILNSIPINELIELFRHESFYNHWISRNICKRLVTDPNQETFFEYLFEALKDATYAKRLQLRKPLDAIVPLLNETKKMEYFTYFFHSHYLYERKAAIKLAESIWNVDIQYIFLKRYEHYKEAEVWIALLRNLDTTLLLDMLKAEYPMLSNSLKGIIINRLKGTALNELEFISTNDPSTFLRLATYTGEIVDDHKAKSCYENISKNQQPFALYNLGLLGKWSLIKTQIQEYLNDPANAFPHFI